jgi:phage terminase large subunit-like protein
MHKFKDADGAITFVLFQIANNKSSRVLLVTPSRKISNGLLLEILKVWDTSARAQVLGTPTIHVGSSTITFPNGATMSAVEADEYSLLGRMYDLAWVHDVASWKYFTAWEEVLFALRLGSNPSVVESYVQLDKS